MLVGLGVDACPEGNAVNIVGIPPVPCDLSRLDPAGVAQSRFGSQAKHDVRIDQPAVFRRDCQDAPWEVPRPACLRDIICALDDGLIPVPLQLHPGRIPGKKAAQSVRFGIRREAHARIIQQIGFGNDNIEAVGHPDQRGQGRKTRRLDAAHAVCTYRRSWCDIRLSSSGKYTSPSSANPKVACSP